MNSISLDYSHLESFLSSETLETEKQKHTSTYERILRAETNDEDVLGWMDLESTANTALMDMIEEKANEIRGNADIFVLIGVGGSNQSARAVIKALQTNGPEIIYTGNNLSAHYMNRILEKIKGKSVYVNVIAKNFATLEPGLCFRVIRQYMEATYGEKDAAKRIIATGSPEGSSLELLASEKGYLFLPFPIPVGGRFSAITSVGLFPMAVAGIDIRQLVKGAKDMKERIQKESAMESDALAYGIIRNFLYDRGYAIELLAYFEPDLEYLGKWWVQLFAESEGKDDKGLFPASASFSEDLHSLGQWIQSGKKNLMETFIHVEEPLDHLTVKADITKDNFDYLDGLNFYEINQIAFNATVKAHSEGHIPCLVLNLPRLNAYYFGQLFYFYEMVCFVSASILGVNPFDQPGVEAYKNLMFENLKSIK